MHKRRKSKEKKYVGCPNEEEIREKETYKEVVDEK